MQSYNRIELRDIILSILKTKDLDYVRIKLEELKQFLILSEVEKKIVSDIEEQLQLGNILSGDYLKEKFSYYFSKEIYNELKRDGIDSAISSIKLEQDKDLLGRDLIDLSSKINKLSLGEIRSAISTLNEKSLSSIRQDTPENSIQRKENPYEEHLEETEGLSLLLPEIEQYTGKAIRGDVVVIVGFTNSYKSTFAFNLAYENALLGNNILYIALEDTSSKLITKMVLNHNAKNVKDKKDLIKGNDLRDKRLSKEQIERYNFIYNDFVDKVSKNLILWDTKDIKVDNFLDMTEALREADTKFKEDIGKGLDAIVIDQVSLLKYARATSKATYDGGVINDWVNYFKQQALSFLNEKREIVVFLVAQTSRDAYREASKEKKKGMYDSSCVSDAHEIERTAETLITLYKDWEEPLLLINIPKARRGETLSRPIQARVYGEYSHVGELDIFRDDAIDTSTFGSGKKEKYEDVFKGILLDIGVRE